MAAGSLDQPSTEVTIFKALIRIGIEPDPSSHRLRIMRNLNPGS